MLVAGDLFESAAPPPEAQRVVWDALLALRETGARVVVIGGNHDNQSRSTRWSPLFGAAGITVLGHAARPERGGVVELARPRPANRVVSRCCRSCRSATRCRPSSCSSSTRRRPSGRLRRADARC